MRFFRTAMLIAFICGNARLASEVITKTARSHPAGDSFRMLRVMTEMHNVNLSGCKCIGFSVFPAGQKIDRAHPSITGFLYCYYRIKNIEGEAEPFLSGVFVSPEVLKIDLENVPDTQLPLTVHMPPTCPGPRWANLILRDPSHVPLQKDHAVIVTDDDKSVQTGVLFGFTHIMMCGRLPHRTCKQQTADNVRRFKQDMDNYYRFKEAGY